MTRNSSAPIDRAGQAGAAAVRLALQLARSAAGAARDYWRGAQVVHDVRSSAGVQSSRYAAAQPTRLGSEWRPVTKDVNTIVSTQAHIIRARVQQLVRDFPFFARAAKVMVNYTVGTGIQYQPKVRDADGRLNKALNQQLEDAWNYWADQADLGGKQHLYDLMRLSKRQDVESGEFIAVLVRSSDQNRYLPVSLRLYESDWLTSDRAKGENGETLYDVATGIVTVSTGRAILGGVEFDAATGETLAFHLAEPGSHKPPVRVPARWVSHGHEVLRPNQKRGISPFATAILVAHDLSDIMNAEIDAAHMAAKWLAFVESPDISSFQGLRSQLVTGDDGTAKKIEYVENAILEYLRPGEKVTMNSYSRPSGNFEPFVRLILRMVAVSTDTSYEILSGDYTGLSYSNAKIVRNDMLENYEPITARHIFQCCRPWHRWFMDALFLSGRVSMPGYEINPAPYLRAYWRPSGHRSIDPLREGKAHIDAMKSLTMSPQEICRERGRDLDDVLADFAEAKAMAAEQGLDIFELLQLVSTAQKNNPAAVGGGETTDDDGQKGGKALCRRIK